MSIFPCIYSSKFGHFDPPWDPTPTYRYVGGAACGCVCLLLPTLVLALLASLAGYGDELMGWFM